MYFLRSRIRKISGLLFSLLEDRNEADSEVISWNEFYYVGLVLIAPHLAPPKLVLRFLPKDVYEAGKDHPVPSLPKQLLCQLLLVMAAVYMAWAYKDVADGVKKERLSFGEAYKRLLTFLLVEKTFDIVCLDQILCMSTDYYQRCYPETKGCSGWRNRSWNNKNQAARLVLYPVLCAAQAYILTRNRGNG